MKIKNKNVDRLNSEKGLQYNSGQAMMVATVLFLVVSVTIIFGLANPILKQQRTVSNLTTSKQSYFLAEAGIENVVYKLKTGRPVASSETLDLNGSTVTTVTTDVPGGKEVVAVGDVKEAVRKVEASIVLGTGVSFSFGIQAGNGGLVLKKDAGVMGNVYANGDIIGTDNTSFITGTAFAADTAPLVEDQTNDSGTPAYNTTFGNANGTQDFAQSFKVSATGLVMGVDLYLKKVSTPSNLTVRIVTDSNGKPSKATLASGTLSASLVSTTYGWINVPFSTNPSLTAGTTYWIVLDGSTNSSKYYQIGANNNGYVNGTGKIGAYSGTWNNTTPSGLDGFFKLYIGGVLSTIDTVTIGKNGVGNAYANEVKNSTVAGTIYCQTGSGNNKSCNTSLSDPSPIGFPISDANIQQWKDDSNVGIPISGDYTPAGSSSTLGPKKINGNLFLTAGHTLTLTGGVWVTGDIFVEGNAKIILDPSFGTSSGVLVADGQVHMEGNGLFSGSGQPGSYVLLLSTLHCDGTSTTSSDTGHTCGHHNGAIDLHDDTDARGVIMYAKDGQVNMHKRVKVTEIAAKKIILGEGTVLTYEQGVTNLNFFTGPSGSWNIESWKEIE